MSTKAGQNKVKKIITDRIIEQLNAGTIPWHKPWVGSGSTWSRRNGKPYGIINQMMLNADGEYATFKAITNEGGKVNKGAKGQYIVEFWATKYNPTDGDGNVMLNDDGDPVEKIRWSLRYDRVFNIERDTNLKVRYHKDETKKFNGQPIALAEGCFDHYINRYGIRLSHDNTGQAFYSPLGDFINLPLLNQFEVVEEYYSTAFHEAAHSTGHSSRLDRLTHSRFGSEKYGKEELVAELTSAAIMNTLGLEIDSTFQNSAAYIENWKKAIKGGELDIISASAFADKAYDMILDGFNPKTEQPASVNFLRRLGKSPVR